MPYQLITFNLKQFSGEAISTCRFIVFKAHNLGFDLFMARHAGIVDRLRNSIPIAAFHYTIFAVGVDLEPRCG